MNVGLFVGTAHRPSWRCCGSHGSFVRLPASWRVHLLICIAIFNSYELLLHPAHICNHAGETRGAHMDHVRQTCALLRLTLSPQDGRRTLRHRVHEAVPVVLSRCPPGLHRGTLDPGAFHTCCLSSACSFLAARDIWYHPTVSFGDIPPTFRRCDVR